jgi:hypothetical protein
MIVTLAMQPTYLHQTYLPVTVLFRTPRSPHSHQPFTDLAINKWLNANKSDALRMDVIVPGYLALSDVPSDQALCMVILVVNDASGSIFTVIGH